jgi:carboxyl-terminal processing protease
MPPQPSSTPPSRPDGGGVTLSALVLMGLGAAVIFWAGLTLGSGSVGRNDQERAAIEAFTETYQRIADDFIGTPLPETVLEGAIDGMFEVLDDPNSRYMPADEYESALDNAMGEFEGIGAVMATEDGDGQQCEAIEGSCQLRVLEVLAGAPAEEAGLLAGDVVTGVDGRSLTGTTIDDSVLLIRGPRGSRVTLTLERDGAELELPITRDTVVADDIHATTLADGRVGYIGIDNFSANAADEFEEALEEHLDAAVEGVVIDVRDDPGGFVDATVEISSQFLADGVVFWEEDAQGGQVAVDVIDDGLAADADLSVAVLVNGGSASASEILAAALQDAGRATIVGETTFGKGTVQEWNELPGEAGGYRLSVAKWLTRDKRWIDRVGLTPDVPVALEGPRFRAGIAGSDPAADPQLQAAVAAVLGEPPSPLLPSPSSAPSASAEAAPSPTPRSGEDEP